MAKSKRNPSIKHSKTRSSKKEEKPHSWAVVRSLFTCKHLQEQQILKVEQDNNKNKKVKCYSGSSICNNTKVMHMRPDPSSHNEGSIKVTLNELNKANVSSSSTTKVQSSVKGMTNLRKLSGCYECRMVIDPVLGMTKDPSLRSTICSCPQCGDIFMKPDHLELHQAVRHAVSELGPEDTSRNIVEIIFQSSWLNKKMAICKIDRILKVHNTPTTISRFEEYRDAIKAKASNVDLTKKHPRCIADGNELLRFHCTTFMCSLGLNGSSNLCTVPNCNVCTIIKNGFKLDLATTTHAASKGILTTATSGKAHDNTRVESNEEHDKRAMLVCRVIAGRVKKICDENNMEEYDSIGGAVGVYSNLDELYVFNPRSILPCFVVIYKGF